MRLGRVGPLVCTRRILWARDAKERQRDLENPKDVGNRRQSAVLSRPILEGEWKAGAT